MHQFFLGLCEACGGTWLLEPGREHYYCPRPECAWLLELWPFSEEEFPELKFPEKL